MTYITTVARAVRPAVDANDVLAWYMTGADGAVEANQGSGGACDLGEIGTRGPYRQMPGIFGYGALTMWQGIFCSARPAPVALPATFSITHAFTVAFSNTSTALSGKKYANDNSWAEPFSSAALYLLTAGFGGYLAVGGTRKNIGSLRAGGPNVFMVPGQPHVATLTYNGATGATQLMADGQLIDSINAGTPIDGGGNAEWYVSGRSRNDPVETHSGEDYDFRVANIVRPLSYNLAFYRAIKANWP